MKKGERGSAMIEAAFIFPVLLAILVGAAGLALQLLAYNFVSYAAHEATRYAEVRGATSAVAATPESVEAYVRRRAMGVPVGDISVRTEWLPDNRPGSRVRVEVAVGDLKATSEVVVLR